MTEKKKVVNKDIKDMIKRMTKITTHKASSHINEKGDLVQDKYNSHISFNDTGGDRGATSDDVKEYEKNLEKHRMVVALYNDDDTYRKKSKSKPKKCRCKK
jgi:hypothetical protein